MPDTMHDPDSDTARLERHRDLFRTVPKDHVPPKSAAIEALEDRLKRAELELSNALIYVDKIRSLQDTEIAYETMQKSGFKRKNWMRNYTLADARKDANTAAQGLRRAWEILDPTTASPFTPTGTAPAREGHRGD